MDDQTLAGIPAENQPEAQTPGQGPKRVGRGLKAAGLVAAGVIAGGTLAATMSAVAAETPTPSTSSNAATNGTPDANGYGTPPSGTAPNGTAPNGPPPNGQRGPGGPQAMRSDETVLTGTDLEKAKAAALKAVPGGTVVRAETDAGDAEYEVHMTKSDGTVVTVKLDKSFAVTAVEDGMGKGDPNAGGPQGQSPSGTTGSNGTTNSSSGA